jgi:hypothetical protein
MRHTSQRNLKQPRCPTSQQHLPPKLLPKECFVYLLGWCRLTTVVSNMKRELNTCFAWSRLCFIYYPTPYFSFYAQIKLTN